MKQSGFTLIELLVVVIILSTLTAIALPQYRRAMDRSRAAEAMQILPALFEARERWMIEHGCKWRNGAISSCTEVLRAAKLDIEMRGDVVDNNTASNNDIDMISITTPNFLYNLVVPGKI